MKSSREVYHLETETMYQKVQKVLKRNRIRLSLLIFTIFISKNIVDQVQPHDIFDFRDAWGPAGMLLVLAGVGLRSWAAGIIHKSESLATIGPYSLTRHPLYIGSLLMAIGFCTVIGDVNNFLVIFAVAVIFYVPKIHREETRLFDTFGEEWTIYKNHTSIFYPKTYPALRAHWSFSQWLRHREYYALCTCLIVLALLKLLHEYPISEIISLIK
ncbi:MAG: isoprenylcysteine carboxylmethyltransferase family protein [Nitrospiraceae bacterium]|nr:MAG: isoprenylcysteine carboxylmethyltransferase family protein [Nitrospiraceae bacterium]